MPPDILSEAKRTGFRYRRLTKHLWIKFGLSLSENTIKAILKHNNLKPKKGKPLPRYAWHLMDVATRARFTAHSYELSSTFGFLFLNLVLLCS